MVVKFTKNQKKINKIFNKNIKYSIHEASNLIKKISFTKFDSSVDLSIKLGVNPKKNDQMIRGVTILPHGTGKKNRILALIEDIDKYKFIDKAEPDYLGFEEYIDKIKKGWLEFDVIVTTPFVMLKLGPLGKILGPRGLMPNPKNGTVTLNPFQAIKEIRSGRIEFKVDRYGILHVCVGKTSFSSNQILENVISLIKNLYKFKPSSVKGEYIKSVYMSSTMSFSIGINLSSLEYKK